MSPNMEIGKQIREARRNNSFIALTWQLFSRYLGEYQDNPRKALELAQAAIEVWKEFEDSNYMEMPEAPPVMFPSGTPPVGDNPMVAGFNFGEMMQDAAIAMAKELRKNKDVAEQMRNEEEAEGEKGGKGEKDISKAICCEASFRSNGEKHDEWCEGT